MSNQKYCNNCNHKCHCESNLCDKLVGVGMSDKYEVCGCEKCSCSSIKENK